MTDPTTPDLPADETPAVEESRGDYGRTVDDGPLYFSEEPLVFSDGDDEGFEKADSTTN